MPVILIYKTTAYSIKSKVKFINFITKGVYI